MHGFAVLTALEGTCGIPGVEAYLAFFAKAIKVCSECGVEGGSRDEELDEGFLEDKTARWAPAMDGVSRWQTIDGGLGGDGPVALCPGQLGEFGGDESGLRGESCGFGPRELNWISACEVRCEETIDFFRSGWCVPEGKSLGWGHCQRRWRVGQGWVEGRRAGVTEAPIRVVIPGSFT